MNPILTLTAAPYLHSAPQAAAPDYLQTPHPNPATDLAEFRYTTPDLAPALLSIRDIRTGKEVLSQRLAGAVDGTATLPVSALAPGVYTCTLLVAGRPVATQKLILVR
ncbi:hypothetical protein GCM10027048_09120 [Hymenobacter coalescens]